MKAHINYDEDHEDVVDIEDQDMWNVDVTIAKIVAPLIRRLMEHEYLGTPGELIFEYDDSDEEDAHKRWLEILDHIAWSMEQVVDEEFEKFTSDDKPENTDGWKYIDVIGPGFWMNYRADKEYHAKIQEGIELFGKYFRSLWT